MNHYPSLNPTLFTWPQQRCLLALRKCTLDDRLLRLDDVIGEAHGIKQKHATQVLAHPQCCLGPVQWTRAKAPIDLIATRSVIWPPIVI
jgi:hypothetical protein